MDKTEVKNAIVPYLEQRENTSEPAPGLYEMWNELGQFDEVSVARRSKVKSFLQASGLSLLSRHIRDYGRVPLWKIVSETTQLIEEGKIKTKFDEATSETPQPRRRYYRT